MQILLTFFFSSLILLAAIHIVALKFFLYWKYLWLDLPVHALGGLCIALGIAILPFFRIRLPKKYVTFTTYMCVVLGVGIIWEIFEYNFGLSGLFVQDDFVLDTTIDLGMDILGGIIGYGIVSSVHKLDSL